MSARKDSQNMVMSVLEGRVPEEQWPALRRAFEKGTAELPPQIVRAQLVQNTNDPTMWRGIAFWKNRHELEDYRRSVETPRGVFIFREVGVEPTLDIFEIVGEAEL